METLIHFVAGLALLAVVSLVAIGIILLVAYIGGRQANQQLDPNSPLNYGRRPADYPSQRFARRQEDDVRAAFLEGCD